MLTDLVQETLPRDIPLALRVFGDTPDSCETDLAIALGPLDRGAAVDQIAAIESVDGVPPLATALERVSADLDEVDGPKIVVLVTDDEETCGGNPQRALRDPVNQGIDVRVNIVGFAVDDEELKAQFEEWARVGGGQFFDASGADDLSEVIASALQPPFFAVRDSAGAVIGSGAVGGDAVRLPPGTYSVEVRSEPSQTFSDIVVGNGEEVVLSLSDDG